MSAASRWTRRNKAVAAVAGVFAVAVPISIVVGSPQDNTAAVEATPADIRPSIDPRECGRPSDPVTPCEIVVNKELMITELCVVEDPLRTRWDSGAAPDVLGAWTFGKLMASVAGLPDIDADPGRLSDYTHAFLEHWLIDQDGINPPCSAAKRPSMADRIIGPWEEISGGRKLDMRLAPFRLLAIVSRLDLRKNPVYGDGNAGESRFVFGVLNIDPRRPDPDAWSQTPFTVIFEYKLPARDCEDVLRWSRMWHENGSIPFGPDFNTHLQGITDRFAGFMADPSRPNGSALGQVRTNENFLNREWELREFHLDGSFDPAPLVETTVALTPDLPHNNMDILAHFIALNEPDIIAETHDVPLHFDDQCFRAVSSLNPLPVWDAPGWTCTEARHKLALNTCSGCHGTETDTRFLHVFPRDIHNESQLSRFLTGQPTPDVFDPTCGGAVVRQFNDLERRALDLCDLLNANCDRRGGGRLPPIFEIDELDSPTLTDGAEVQPQQRSGTATPTDIFNTPHMARNRVH